jgi:MFS family permease
LSEPPHYRWSIVALTLLNQALVVGVLIYSFALFVVPWLEEFEISRGRVMLAIFGFQVISGLISPVFGRLMDQYSMRWLVIGGTFAIAGGLALMSLATAFWQIIVIQATLLPIGMILCGTLASQTMVSKWFIDRRSLAIGLSAMGTSLGGFVLPVVTEYLIGRFEWQTALLVLAAATLCLMAPVNYFVLRRQPPVRVSGKWGSIPLDAKNWTSIEILRSRSFWIPVLGLIPVNAAFGGVQFNLGAYVHDLGMAQVIAAQLIAITSVSMIAGKFCFGALGDHVDHRKLYWVMAFTLLVALFFYEGSPGIWQLRLAAVLQGLATGGVMPMMGIMYASRFGTLSFGRVLGLVHLFLMLGSLGSIFTGWIYDRTASYDLAFHVFMLGLLPFIVIMWFLPAAESNQPSG